MRRLLLWLNILLGVLLSGLAIAVLTWHAAKPTPIVVPPQPHQLAATPPPSPAFYDNMRQALRFYITDPKYGAKGDDVHDDTSAINAATTEALATGGVVIFPNPTVAYKVTSELPGNGPINWRADGTGLGQAIIRAHGSMRSILALRSTFGLSNTATTRAKIQGVTFDCNGPGNAKDGVLFLGVQDSKYDAIGAKNCTGRGVHSAILTLAATLGSVTASTPGGSPNPGLSISQPDINYIGLDAVIPGVTHFVEKVTTGGALGTARLETSLDNGATYQSLDQPISATVNIGIQSGPDLFSSGITGTFVAGTYHIGDTYSFPVTLTAADSATPASVNTDIELYDTYFQGNGSIYATAAIQPNYIGACAQSVVTPGTIGTVSGSNLLTGTGTAFMSMGARDGDIVFINGHFYMVSLVADDTHIIVVTGSEPQVTHSGDDFAVSVGGGYTEDGLLDGNRAQFFGGYTLSNSVGLRFAASQGPQLYRTHFESYGLVGAVFGGANTNQPTGTVLIRPHAESVNPSYFLGPGTTGTILNSAEAFNTVGSPSGWWVRNQTSQEYGIGATVSNVPIFTLSLASSNFTITSPSQSIPAPDMHQPASQTSFLELSATSAMTLTGTPTVTQAAGDGVIYRLINVGSFPITFQSNSWASTGLNLFTQYETLGHNESMTIHSVGGNWDEVERSRRFSNGQTGNDGESIRVFKTTTTTPIDVWDLDILNGGLSTGTLAVFSVMAQAQTGTDFAVWKDCTLAYTSTAVRLGYSCAFISASSGNASTWTMLPTDNSPFGQIFVTGDNSGNAVFWQITMRPMSAPQGF